VIEKGVSAMSTRRAARAVFVVVLLVIGSADAIAAPGALVAQPKGSVLNLTVTSSRISLTARETPLADVLAAIGRMAGVKMVMRGDLNTSVTATLVNVPLDDAIQRLSRWHSVVLIYKGSTEGVGAPVLTEVWVTRSSPDLAKANPRGLEPPARDTSRDARADARLPAEWEQAAKALIAFKDANPETRSQQIEALVRAQGEDAIVAALREVATRNPDPRVRRSAIQVLGSMGSPQALAAVQATLSDANASVRSEALTALRRQSRPRSSDGSVD
jgi:HEAT repeats